MKRKKSSQAVEVPSKRKPVLPQQSVAKKEVVAALPVGKSTGHPCSAIKGIGQPNVVAGKGKDATESAGKDSPVHPGGESGSSSDCSSTSSSSSSSSCSESDNGNQDSGSSDSETEKGTDNQ